MLVCMKTICDRILVCMKNNFFSSVLGMKNDTRLVREPLNFLKQTLVCSEKIDYAYFCLVFDGLAIRKLLITLHYSQPRPPRSLS